MQINIFYKTKISPYYHKPGIYKKALLRALGKTAKTQKELNVFVVSPKEMLEIINDYDCDVAIETNGCIPINPDLYYPKRLKFVMDVKCPSSGVSEKNVLDNLMFLRSRDEVKFVVSDYEDYEFARDILKKYPTPAKVLFSPVILNMPNHIGGKLVNWILEDKLYNVRVQVQMHKFLNVQ